MRNLSLVVICGVVICGAVLGCGGGTDADAGPAGRDAFEPNDALEASDAAADASAPDARGVEDAFGASDAPATSDVGADLDAASEDAGVSEDSGAGDGDAAVVPDAGAGDAGPPANACEAGGGRCVAVVPSACARGVVGHADWYSCGGGLGVMCCLPTRTAPACREIGTADEGWYQPDGTLVCRASCARATLTCENAGTRSEGWYATPPSASCGAVEGLVEWTDCAP